MKFFDTLRRALGGSRARTQREQPVTNFSGWTIGNPDARHPYEVTPDHPAADVIAGMEFCATFQVRTPLRILRRHGQVLALGSDLPDDFEPWMGIWIAKPKSWHELGIVADELEPVIASPAGPVTAAQYLPFLIAVREAVENTAAGTEGRIQRLQAVCARPPFARYVEAEGGMMALCDRFFPPVLSLISGLPSSSQAALRQLGLCTVHALRTAADSTLLRVNGIGPAKLQAIRDYCGEYGGDPHADRAVNVEL